MTIRQAVALAVLVGIIGTAGVAPALTGSGDSSPFGLNTRWTSGVEDQADLPNINRLGDCYPNPFNPSTRIRFELSRPAVVTLRIYDLQGRLVRTLVENDHLVPGRYESEWDGRDEREASAAAGVYLYRLVTDGFSASRRMTLMK